MTIQSYDPIVGPASDKTLANVRAAQFHAIRVKQTTYAWKFWTGTWFWKRIKLDHCEEWWDRGPLGKFQLRASYWLCFAWAVYWPVPTPVELQEFHEGAN